MFILLLKHVKWKLLTRFTNYVCRESGRQYAGNTIQKKTETSEAEMYNLEMTQADTSVIY